MCSLAIGGSVRRNKDCDVYDRLYIVKYSYQKYFPVITKTCYISAITALYISDRIAINA